MLGRNVHIAPERSFTPFPRTRSSAELNPINFTSILVKPPNTKRKRDRLHLERQSALLITPYCPLRIQFIKRNEKRIITYSDCFQS